MKAHEIHLTDLLRILVGDVPASYYIELIIRAAAVYIILMVSMRSMGKRMSSQLSRNELAALVSLAAAVGVPMMAPDRGILPAVVIAFVLIAVQRVMAKRSFNNEKFESFAQGNVSVLITNGIVDMNKLARAGVAHERVFAELRSQGVLHLGTVSRLYMEASGMFTVIPNPKPVPGLCVLPPWDDPLKDLFNEHSEHEVCVQCGLPKENNRSNDIECSNCGSEKWVAAVQEVETNKEVEADKITS